MLAHALTRHLQTPSEAARGVWVRVHRSEDGALTLKFCLEGDLSLLRIPQPGLPRRADRLWQHTCFEAFVAEKGAIPYYEFNFAPSREWAAYRFSAYREAMSLLDLPCAPKIDVRIDRDRVELDAVIGLPLVESKLKLALTSVIEDENGKLSYWALKHPPGKPNFHHQVAFALEL